MRFIVLLLGFQLTWMAVAAEKADTTDTTLVSGKHTNATVLVEGPNDVNIVKIVAQLLQRQHYLRLQINDDVSSKFLDRYLDSLDNLHVYFTQSDLQEFEKYRNRLDEMTLKEGDTSVARLIFSRFRQRLDQQHEYVQELLKKGEFDFTGNDRYIIDRKKLPRPVDLSEAKRLWRDRLRSEYLQ
jgi:carboxyl-terminal processing protease